MGTVLEVHNLKKSFRSKKGPIEAVKQVDLQVEAGQIFGFLGPNGAGKTTTLRILATLLTADAGQATIAGFDLGREPQKVREHIGYVGQLGGADALATGTENLMLQGQLYGLSSPAARQRAAELTDILQIAEFADRKTQTYSGGQRRRLDVALGLMHEPDVLFLDEPTTGLDPQNRSNLWELIRVLRERGTAIFLTTHYLEEADVLADDVAIIDQGTIVAKGSPRELKQQIAGDTLILKPREADKINEMQNMLRGEEFVRESRIEGEKLRLQVADGTNSLPRIFRVFETANLELETVELSQPSLDDVFLKKTGRSLRDVGATEGEQA